MNFSLKSLVYGVLLTWYTMSPVWADDTEIYFAGTANLIVRPNILFVLDTSGSMDDRPSGVYSGPDKMDSLQSSMTTILSTVQDVNVGLMRFSIPGGPILYPVKYIDEEVSTFEAMTGTSQSTISSDDDDAEERSDGTVVLNSDSLIMMESEGFAVSNTVQATVTAGSNDAYEISSNSYNGFVRNTRSSIWLNYRSGYYHTAGVRFSSVDVPKDADITSATIDFTVNNQRSGSPQIDIYGQKSTNASAFSNYYYNLSNRTKTTAKVDWNIPSSYNPGAGSILTAPYTAADTPPDTDLSAIVSEITSQSGWVSGNPMVFLFERQSGNSSNYRQVYSYDGSNDDAPVLNITYGSTQAGATNALVALRFNNVWVPQGADITSATVSVTAAADSDAGGDWLFRAEAADDSEAFTDTDSSLSVRTQTTAVATDSLPAWTEGDSYTSPDLSEVIEEVTDRSGWCGGSSITVFVSGVTAEKLIRSHDDSSATAPVLDIAYDTGSVSDSSCFMHEAEVLVTDSDDDVEQNGTSVDYDGTQLQLGGNDYTGLRFNDVPLIGNAEIQEAYLEFSVADNDVSLPASLTIELQSSNDAPAYTYSTRPSTRSTVSGSVSWSISSGWTTSGTVYRSPDISDLLESVVGLSGWDAGNSVAVIITGSGQVEGSSYDGSNIAPKLVIKASQDQFDIASTTVRDELLAEIEELSPSGNTPVVDTYYEGALYYKGLDVDYGKTRGYSYSNPSNRYTRVSHPDSYVGGTVVRDASCTDADLSASACADEYIDDSSSTPTYTSPITEACQKSYIVLLTDGYANENESITKIESMIETHLKSVDELGDEESYSCENIDNDEECGHELANFMANYDQSGLTGTQKVKTHTIGFDINDSWLQGIATEGDGTYYEVDNAADLTEAFDQIIKAIKAANTTFTQPGFTVNNFNRLSHREDIYFSLFKPQEYDKWYGNLKKYRLDGATKAIVDLNGDPAVSSETGFFQADTQSFWSDEPDGIEVESGGAAENAPTPSTRNLFTYTGAYPSPLNSGGLNVLSHSNNSLNELNDYVTKAMLGIESESNTYRRDLIRWARGEDSNRNNRQEMGDPLHSIPIIVTYDTDPEEETYDSTVFVGTNEGYIHAIDADDGSEVFSFVPQELLSNLNEFYVNAETGTDRPYGMDGGLSVIAHDDNGDDDFLDTYDYVWLYAGMRRGGRNYYSLDVSDRSNPELKWVIKGGSGGTTGFTELGYTWSKPTEISVNFDGTTKTLLLFGGGYDPSQDSRTTRGADVMGRAIYMVDADTGELFWSAGSDDTYDLTLADMDYSVPSDITVLDMNRDGNADQFYVGDMGGQVWRFDINNGTDDLSALVNGAVIADLSTSGSTANNRRFYHAPDLALVVDGNTEILTIGIGSGWRAHPLDEVVEDRFYLIKQFSGIYGPPSSYTELSESNLYDATNNLIHEGTEEEQEEAELGLTSGASRTHEGWYIRLTNPGEKVLAKSLTIAGKIVFTTYEPEPPDEVSCQAVQGTARAYYVDILLATPQIDGDNDGDLDKSDRAIALDQGAIPASPKIIDPETGAPVVLIGPEILDEVDTGKQLYKTYWRENEE
ncbi:PilC/PilY family type IV pilus protein [Neptuniibacter sp.]|uniref:PilC/PilY family type IV pilus protein n=1 Tax=Neptuniibacter sp. TaxID=1962643 RepID=UPI002632D07F|nr:PilC/PilY family type IV pilus protein [Neptuniibacter sp.]MCP4598359.1 hypothetical protein [Neptuniibacter sp.]